MAQVPLDGILIDVPHSLAPDEVLREIEQFAQDLAENRFPDWGVRLYRMTWRNPEPAREVATLDFVSGGRGTAPFLVAITAESP